MAVISAICGQPDPAGRHDADPGGAHAAGRADDEAGFDPRSSAGAC